MKNKTIKTKEFKSSSKQIEDPRYEKYRQDPGRSFPYERYIRVETSAQNHLDDFLKTLPSSSFLSVNHISSNHIVLYYKDFK